MSNVIDITERLQWREATRKVNLIRHLYKLAPISEVDFRQAVRIAEKQIEESGR